MILFDLSVSVFIINYLFEMQTYLSLAAFASAAYASGTVKGADSMKIKHDGFEMVGTISGGWDLLKQGNLYDMQVTLKQQVKFNSAYKAVNGDEWSMFTCYDTSSYWDKDHWWQMWGKYNGSNWEF